MNIDEHKLSQDSQDVLHILRTEMQAGRLTESQLEMVRDWATVSASLGIISKFVVKLAGFILALGGLITAWGYVWEWMKK